MKEGVEFREKLLQLLRESTVCVSTISVREMADKFHTSTSVVNHHLERLEYEGLIEFEYDEVSNVRKARMIRVKE